MDIDPELIEAVHRRMDEILEKRRIPERLFICMVNGAPLVHPGPDNQTVMLLFSHPFGASDYLRATGVPGTVAYFPVEQLGEEAQNWLSSGVQLAALDRCPRCPAFPAVTLEQVARWTTEDFAKVWANHRAARMVSGELKLRSAMNCSASGDMAGARAELEYIRDHLDCGIPFLHQMIGMYAGLGNDTAAKNEAMERLKEFGLQFEKPLDFSPEFVAETIGNLMANFGMLPSVARTVANV